MPIGGSLGAVAPRSNLYLLNSADAEAPFATSYTPLEYVQMTFDELFSEFTLTAEERTALIWHLAMLRARRTVEALTR